MASSSRKVIYAALAGNALIAVTKFVAAAHTGSAAMLSEGIHSVVDTGNQFLLLFGMHRARRPPDPRYPFGHGREVYFWSFVVALLIFAVGAGISIYKGVHHILAPEPMESPGINYLVLGLAFLFEGTAWTIALREFSRAKGDRGYIAAIHAGKDPSFFVVLFEDSAAMLGLGVAFLGILLGQITGSPYWDGTASILIGVILAATAAWLAYETHGLLIGESADPTIVRGIRGIAAEAPGVRHINEILTMHMGPEDILVNLSVDFEDTLSAAEVERSVAWMDRRLKRAYPRVRRIFIESEARWSGAATPDSET